MQESTPALRDLFKHKLQNISRCLETKYLIMSKKGLALLSKKWKRIVGVTFRVHLGEGKVIGFCFLLSLLIIVCWYSDQGIVHPRTVLLSLPRSN